MKVLISGKGGSGKSTIVVLLAKELAKKHKVLVVDNDESNSLLPHQLGVSPPTDFMNYFGGKKVLFEKMESLQKGWKLDNLPNEYLSQAQGKNLRLLTMGKIREYGEGCACPMNVLSSRFLENVSLDENEFLIVDTDAGIEHFGRRVENGIDLILVVVGPSQESVTLAHKISEFGEQISRPVYYVLNRVDEESTDILLNALDRGKVMAIILEDKRIFKSSLTGKELDFSLKGVEELAAFLEVAAR